LPVTITPGIADLRRSDIAAALFQEKPMSTIVERHVILTGHLTTGPLHLGHYTGSPDHLRVSDPSRLERHVVFTCLDACDEDPEAVADLKVRYRRGGLGDTVVKQQLEAVLKHVVTPIRERRVALAHAAPPTVSS
jgi:tryptophanyl-tRNA synthetase